MNDAAGLLAVLAGFVVRLSIPILVTALAVHFLRKLDAYWQTEATAGPLNVEKPQCWKVQGCSPAKRKGCLGFKSPLPCWQALRQPNGYLTPQCLACRVFLQAPLPAHA